MDAAFNKMLERCYTQTHTRAGGPCKIFGAPLTQESTITRNITFAADAALIEEARAAAKEANTALDEQFLLWLEQYARRRRAQRAMETIARLRKYVDTGGMKFSREQMNERR